MKTSYTPFNVQAKVIFVPWTAGCPLFEADSWRVWPGWLLDFFFFFCQQLDTYLWWLLYSLKWYFYAKLKIQGWEKIFNPEYTHSCPAPGKDSSACVRELLRPAQQVGIESGQCTVWEKETRDRIKVLKMGRGIQDLLDQEPCSSEPHHFYLMSWHAESTSVVLW